ncbi:O-antigen ligase family protein [Microbulbifer sp. SAOS-129_SWC]|uniref:O-antigen ligase family protein n=1 Tax=Microbulbifer sp. SAOS-129_SWC TaxID=3145235 RepID=UPI0032176DFC
MDELIMVYANIKAVGGVVKHPVFLGWVSVLLCWFWFFVSFNSFDLSLSVTPYDHKRVMQVVLICLFTLCFCFREYRRSVSLLFQDRQLVYLWGVSLVSVFLSSLFSENPTHSLFASLHWLLLLSVFCAGFFMARDQLTSWVITGVLVLHALMVFKALLFLVFEVSVGDSLNAALLYPGVEHYRFFNQIQVFLVPLIAIWAVRTNVKKIAYFFLFVNLLLAFCGGARGLLVGLLGAAVLAYLVLKPWRRDLQVMGLVALLAFAFYCAINQFVQFSGPSSDVLREHTSGRLTIWARLIDALDWSNFFIGKGEDAFSYHSFHRHEGHPHSSFLQFIYEWGAIGAIAAVAALVRVLYVAHKFCICHDERFGEKNIYAGLLVSVLAAAIYSLFSGVVVMPIPQTLLFLFAGLLFGGVTGVSRVSEVGVPKIGFQKGSSSSCQSLATGGVVLGVLLLYVGLCSAYLLQQAGAPEVFRGPRFWAEGAAFTGSFWPIVENTF